MRPLRRITRPAPLRGTSPCASAPDVRLKTCHAYYWLHNEVAQLRGAFTTDLDVVRVWAWAKSTQFDQGRPNARPNSYYHIAGNRLEQRDINIHHFSEASARVNNRDSRSIVPHLEQNKVAGTSQRQGTGK